MPILGRDAGAAERAVGVVLEPDVYAVDVENVAAVGDDSELLVVLEFAETDGAFGGDGFGFPRKRLVSVFFEVENGD